MREPKAGITNIIGKGAEVNGKLKIEGSIHIDGMVEGNIETTDFLIIGKSGVVRGEIRTKDGLIGGKVDGNIFASGRLEFQSGSKLKGDMRCKQLVIEEGVSFDGNCAMSEKPTQEVPKSDTIHRMTQKSHNSKTGLTGLDQNYALTADEHR